MRQRTVDESSKSEKIQGSWVVRGIYSASECFSCINKIDHALKEDRISIFCKDYCKYEPKQLNDEI